MVAFCDRNGLPARPPTPRPAGYRIQIPHTGFSDKEARVGPETNPVP